MLSAIPDAPGLLSASFRPSGGALSAFFGGHADLAAFIGGQGILYASVVCEIGDAPYLEIDPTYLWIIPDDLVSNDVYSNTTWNIN